MAATAATTKNTPATTAVFLVELMAGCLSSIGCTAYTCCREP